MKRIVTLFAIIGLIAFSGCEGPEGIPGYDAPLPFVFEVTTDFTGPNYEKNVGIQGMFPSDNVLVYELVGTAGGDQWALLPQIYYFNNGLETAQYNFSFSQNNVRIFIKGSLSDYSQLPSSFRNGKTFRIVLVPGDDGISSKKAKVDYSDYNVVIKKYNIDDNNVKKLN